MKNKLKKAWKDLPGCICVDPLQMKTLSDLVWACRTQLDLCNEGQDGTEHDNPIEIKRWLKKYSPTKN